MKGETYQDMKCFGKKIGIEETKYIAGAAYHCMIGEAT